MVLTLILGPTRRCESAGAQVAPARAQCQRLAKAPRRLQAPADVAERGVQARHRKTQQRAALQPEGQVGRPWPAAPRRAGCEDPGVRKAPAERVPGSARPAGKPARCSSRGHPAPGRPGRSQCTASPRGRGREEEAWNRAGMGPEVRRARRNPGLARREGVGGGGRPRRLTSARAGRSAGPRRPEQPGPGAERGRRRVGACDTGAPTAPRRRGHGTSDATEGRKELGAE
uniref:translation initiation factor IF-2-like n=1 Tax=Ictidomys tridecemlineatus TaxID=43179 RepID=UPI001A9FA0F0|nr:translation initiation factor IF-2-like [Ictidomys tridecemlineatus]